VTGEPGDEWGVKRESGEEATEPGDEWGVRGESGRMLPSFSSLVLFPGQ